MSTSPSLAPDDLRTLIRRRRDAEETQRNAGDALPASDAANLDISAPLRQEEMWALLPVETDIYILPDGRVIVADLPAELAARLPNLGLVEPCEIINHDLSDPAA